MISAKNVPHLAEIMRINKRTVYKQRHDHDPAPEGLDLAEWTAWAQRTGRRDIAARLAAALELPDPTPDQDRQVLPAAPDARCAGEEKGQLSLDFEDAAPGTGKEAAERQHVAKTLRAEDQARRERLELLQLERRLVPIEIFDRFIDESAAYVLEAIGTVIWREILTELDAMAPEKRKAIRAAHDRGVKTIRTNLAKDHRVLLHRLLSEASS